MLCRVFGFSISSYPIAWRKESRIKKAIMHGTNKNERNTKKVIATPI